MSTTFQASEAATPVIVGGKVAKRAYRKHLAYVIVNTKSGSGFTCTGTIVGRRWILTAAHCVDSFNSSEDVDVSSSYAYISPRSLSKNLVKEYFFKSVYVHKNYKPLGLDSRHDIAVVELAKNIQRSKYFPTTLGDAPRPKTNVIGAGYGVLNEDGTPTRFAMQTKVVAQSFRTCASRESNSIRKYLRNKLQVCATSLGFPNEGRTDTCYGDSGGPLFTRKNSKITQYAITSFATSGCASPGGTPWYVRVSFYKENIAAIMKVGSSKKFRKMA